VAAATLVPVATARAAGGPDGPFAVGKITKTFVDTSRTSPASGPCPAANSRTLNTLILYPGVGTPSSSDISKLKPLRADGPYPLIVFSHGFTANGPAYEGVLRDLASHGYVIALPTFPRSSSPCNDLGDYKKQPKDVSFVIDQMLKLSAASTGKLSHLIDKNEIGAAGHSLGAITTLGVVDSSCCADHRIKAASEWSGLELPFGKHGGFNYAAGPPLMIVHGTADEIVPYSNAPTVYGHAIAPKFLVSMINAPHTFFRSPWLAVHFKVLVDFFDRYLKGKADGLTRLEHDAVNAGVSSLTEQAA
jgi:dienelactone hydrolase